MAKLKGFERTFLTNEIEDTFDGYCRHCPFGATSETNNMCTACPVAVKLRAMGSILLGDETVKTVVRMKRWTPARDKRLMNWRSKGLSQIEVAKKLGCSRHSIYKRFKLLTRDNPVPWDPKTYRKPNKGAKQCAKEQRQTKDI